MRKKKKKKKKKKQINDGSITAIKRHASASAAFRNRNVSYYERSDRITSSLENAFEIATTNENENEN